ncbi:MAG: type IV pilus twitching motility protein PilT [Opitutales bacterium]
MPACPPIGETLDLFESLLRLAVENDASDVHIKTGKPAFLRLRGHLESVDMTPLPPEQILQFIEHTVPAEFYDRWKDTHQIDYSYQTEKGEGQRFRVNAFIQRGTPSMVFRYVKDMPPTFEELHHESGILEDLCDMANGIILLCGPTGSGKSSTMAAMLEHINRTLDKHIVTLEDPIEFNFTDNRSIINQREIGLDAPSFHEGLRAVLRQDPDIILVGEMRDAETFETALHAAETGHLVFGTLHAASAQQAVQRLFEFFPGDMQHNMCRQIATTLRATITQKLLPASHGDYRVPCCEVFVVDALAASLIAEAAFEKIPSALEAGAENGSRTFNQDLLRLIQNETITPEIGLKHSPNPKALEMNLNGIFLSSGGIVN